MNQKLVINNKVMDLSPETVIAVTFQPNNLGELQNRQGTYTNTFRLPKTQTNISNLEYISEMTSASSIPYRKLKVTFIDEGIEIISDGEGLITSIDQDFIHLNVVSGNVDLSEAIGDLLVGDLYANDPSFIWDTNSAVSSRDGSKYYIYPLIDWRSDLNTFFTSATVDVRQMLPAATITGMFQRLSNYIGFNFTGDYLNSEDHLSMILTPDQFTISPEYLPQEETKGSLIYTNAVAYSDGFNLGSIVVEEDSGVNFARIFPIQNTFDPTFASNSYIPTVNHIGNLKFNSLLNVRWLRLENYGVFETHYSRDFYIVTRIIRDSDGVVLAEITSEVWSGKVSSDWINFSVALETGNVSLQAGVRYYCAHDFVIASHPNIKTSLSVKAFSSVFKHSPTDILSPGSPIRFRDIYRMKVRDVLRDILNLRGLIIQTNNYTKEVKFSIFDDLIKNKPLKKNWSEKVDKKSFAMAFKFGDYAQKNWLRFKESDQVPDELGDHFFTIDDDNLTKDKTVVQINHSATVQESRFLGYNIPLIDAIDSSVKWQKPGYRILNINRQNVSFNINFNDSLTSQNVSTNIPFARFVGFEELVSNFYSALTSMLEQTKGIKIPILLDQSDVQDLDHTIPIYLNIPELNINGEFYLNKIENYSKGLTAAELIRL